MPVLFLKEADVQQVLTMDMALEAVEMGFKKLGLDEAMNINRQRVVTDHAVLHTMGAAAKTLGGMGTKVYSTSRKGNAVFLVTLFDGKTGDLICLMQADYLGQMRTGAASGLATRIISRPDASKLGIFGSGKQAKTQVEAICKVRNIKRVEVFSPNQGHREQFAKEVSATCGVEVVPVDTPAEAAKGKDIVCTATKARDPFFIPEWLEFGMHVNAVGANYMGKAELFPEAIRRFDTIVVDSKDQARLEAGDFQVGLEDGSLKWSAVWDLSAVVGGRYQVREAETGITLFKSVGLAIQDLAVGMKVYQKALADGLGQMIDW